MAIALVASQNATVNMTAATTTMSPAPPSNFTAKNACLLAIDVTTGAVVGTPLASAVSGGGFSNWTRVGTVWSAAGGPSTEFWLAAGGAGGAKTLTVTMSASSTAGCYLTELSGAGTTIEEILGAVFSSQNTTGTAISLTATALNPGALLFVSSAASSTETASPGAPWTTIAGPTTSGAQRNGLAWVLPAANTSEVAPWTQTTGNWAALGIAINPAASETTADAYAVTSGNASATAANAVATATDNDGNLRQIAVIGDPTDDVARVQAGALYIAGANSQGSVMSALALSAVCIPRATDDTLTIATGPVAASGPNVKVVGNTSGAVYLNQAIPQNGLIICLINPQIDSSYTITWSGAPSNPWYFNTSYGINPSSTTPGYPLAAYVLGGVQRASLSQAAGTSGAILAAPPTGMAYALKRFSTSNAALEGLLIGTTSTFIYGACGGGADGISFPDRLDGLVANEGLTFDNAGGSTMTGYLFYDLISQPRFG